jgi:[ribosomal protein S5]-alanine N-acetyltransferase
MLPADLPVILHPPIVLSAFSDADVGLVQSVATDALIPLIMTVPASGNPDDARAYIDRQLSRHTTGAGYSFAIADAATGDAVGQVGSPPIWPLHVCVLSGCGQGGIVV